MKKSILSTVVIVFASTNVFAIDYLCVAEGLNGAKKMSFNSADKETQTIFENESSRATLTVDPDGPVILEKQILDTSGLPSLVVEKTLEDKTISLSTVLNDQHHFIFCTHLTK